MNHRIAQVESTLKRALATVLQRDLSDPRIQGVVSIVKLDLSPDLKTGHAWVSVMPEKFEKRTIAGLNDAAGHIHTRLKQAVALRTVPRLDYKLDRSLKAQAEVFEAIKEGMERTQATEPEKDDPQGHPA